MMDPKTAPECQEYFDKLQLDAGITPEIYRNAIVSAQKGRAMISYLQELQAYSEDYAQKDFHFCPHVEAARELGATPEELRFFCQEILSAGDYGNMEPHPNVKLEFKKQIGAGDDHCEYCVSRIK